MTREEFQACFETFEVSAFRLEARQTYAVGGQDEFVRAFRAGQARPDRSVRTSSFLREIAEATIAGRQFSRVRIVDWPLTEYTQLSLVAYVENAAAGEEIRVADRGVHPELRSQDIDFWLFDGATARSHAVIINYDGSGSVLGFESVTGGRRLTDLERRRDAVWAVSVSLNEFLSDLPHELRPTGS